MQAYDGIIDMKLCHIALKTILWLELQYDMV